MCFSEQMQLTLTVLILIIGFFTWEKKKYRPQRMLALVPFFLAFHQLIGAGVWASFSRGMFLNIQSIMLMFYLGMIYLFWPVWLPLSFCHSEVKPKYKRALFYLFLIASLVTAALLFTSIFFFTPAKGFFPQLEAWMLAGQMKTPLFFRYVPYVFIIAPFFFSSRAKTRGAGIVLTICAALALFFYPNAFSSVWCILSLLIAIFIYYILKNWDKQGYKRFFFWKKS